MNCEEARLKAQALADNELDEPEIDEVMEHMENCYRCRSDYMEILKLKRKLAGMGVQAPPEEWFEGLYRRKSRKFFSRTGVILLLAANLVLAGFGLFDVLFRSGENLLVKIMVACASLAIVILFIVALSDRLNERKTDRYKEIIK